MVKRRRMSARKKIRTAKQRAGGESAAMAPKRPAAEADPGTPRRPKGMGRRAARPRARSAPRSRVELIGRSAVLVEEDTIDEDVTPDPEAPA